MTTTFLAKVKVPYVDRNNLTTLSYSDDYLFLPAEKEVFGKLYYSPSREVIALTQFAYYKNGGSTIKHFSGSAVGWWLRSVYYSGSEFCRVYPQGIVNYSSASETHGAAPCFCV